MSRRTWLTIGFSSLGVGGAIAVVVAMALALSPAPTAMFTPSPTPKNTNETPVLAAAVPKATLSTDGVAAKLRAANRDKVGTVGVAVLDAKTGTKIATENDKPMMPASILKTVTSAVALEILGPEKVFTTSVAQRDDGQLVLVGGGDPYLRAGDDSPNSPATASLQDLAWATAKELAQKATKTPNAPKKVRLGWDESLFSGPKRHEDWSAAYDVEVPDIAPLWAEAGEAETKARKAEQEAHKKDRKFKLPHLNEAEKATQIFAEHLQTEGFSVELVGATPAGEAPRLAAVESMPVSRIVRQLMMTSDNAATEVLLRHLAIGAGRPATFADGTAVVTEKLQEWGLWRDGMAIRDGSGLSRSNRVTPSAVAGVIQRAMVTDKLRPVVIGMPVAGSTGTLAKRYQKPEAVAGRGIVHAKTGFVNNTNTLAGFVQTDNGAIVAFALMLNDAPLALDPVNWLDETATELAKCGC